MVCPTSSTRAQVVSKWKRGRREDEHSPVPTPHLDEGLGRQEREASVSKTIANKSVFDFEPQRSIESERRSWASLRRHGTGNLRDSEGGLDRAWPRVPSKTASAMSSVTDRQQQKQQHDEIRWSSSWNTGALAHVLGGIGVIVCLRRRHGTGVPCEVGYARA